MALTDVVIRNAKPGAKPIKLADGLGMFLHVTPAGGKPWQLKYRIDGREKLLAMGGHPEIGLSDARRPRDEARALTFHGKDPSREKQRKKLRSRIQAADTFTAIASEYGAKRKRDGEKGWSPAKATRSDYLLSLLKWQQRAAGDFGNRAGVTHLTPSHPAPARSTLHAQLDGVPRGGVAGV